MNNIIKMKIGNVIYDVITYDEFKRNQATYMGFIGSIAVTRGDGLAYPLRHPNDFRPGLYCSWPLCIFRPPYGNDIAMYNMQNAINFSEARNYNEVIEAQEKLNNSERAILTTIDNITIPEIGETDTPAMAALKQAIIAKKIDLDKYDYRFSADNYANDKRLLKRDSITLPKLTAYAKALDIDIEMILRDKDPNVPNPMGKKITVHLTGGE